MRKKISYKCLIIIVLLLVILLLPIGINLCYDIPAVSDVLKKPMKWTEFWGAYLSALASLAMVIITWLTLKQNSKQLDEIKRQWNEQNSPKVFCSLEKSNDGIILVFINVSNSTAADTTIKINSNIQNKVTFKERIDLLNKSHLLILPLQKKYINLNISAYNDGNYDGKYIEVAITTNNVQQGTYRMFLNEINLIRSVDYSPISKKLDNISSLIKKK